MTVTRSAHIDSLLRAYTDTLDTLPFRIAHHFSDLRELDAVLGASIISLNRRLSLLIHALDDPAATPLDRFSLLREVAEDSQKLRMGNEDKIRLAAAAVDEIENHITHSSHILSSAHLLNPALPPLLPPPSVFPHIAHLSPNYVKPVEDKRKSHKRGAGGEKRKAATAAEGDAATEDGDLFPSGAGGRSTPNKRRKKADEKESSVLPPSATNGAPAGRLDGRPERDRRAHPHPLAQELGAGEDDAPKRKDTKRRKAPTPTPTSSPPIITSGPQIAAPVPRPAGAISASHRAKLEGTVDSTVGSSSGMVTRTSSRSERRPPTVGGAGLRTSDGALEPPHFMRTADGAYPTTVRIAMEASEVEFAADSGAELDGPEGEGEGAETDDQNPYCFCRKPSWGEMIGCEDDDCDFQWFHIGCVNVSDPDMFDKWYCETCQKRTGKKPILKGQGGKGNGPTGGARRVLLAGWGQTGCLLERLVPGTAWGPDLGMG